MIYKTTQCCDTKNTENFMLHNIIKMFTLICILYNTKLRFIYFELLDIILYHIL